jgi:hypothetical protein
MTQLSLAQPLSGATSPSIVPIAGGASRLLARGAILQVPRPAGCRIECLAGSLWVTQDNDPRDIMLEPGEECELSGRARVLVQALEPSRLRLRGGQGC